MKEWSRRQEEHFGAERLATISEMLSQSNELLAELGPYEPEPKWSLNRRARNWLGDILLNMAVKIMGDDAPYME